MQVIEIKEIIPLIKLNKVMIFKFRGYATIYILINEEHLHQILMKLKLLLLLFYWTKQEQQES